MPAIDVKVLKGAHASLRAAAAGGARGGRGGARDIASPGETCTPVHATRVHTPAGEGLGRLLSTRHHRHSLADDPECQTNREETSQVSWKKCQKIQFF